MCGLVKGTYGQKRSYSAKREWVMEIIHAALELHQGTRISEREHGISIVDLKKHNMFMIVMGT